jgi:hypothetical protein
MQVIKELMLVLSLVQSRFILPLGTKVDVVLNQKAIGGKTIIAIKNND